MYLFSYTCMRKEKHGSSRGEPVTFLYFELIPIGNTGNSTINSFEMSVVLHHVMLEMYQK